MHQLRCATGATTSARVEWTVRGCSFFTPAAGDGPVEAANWESLHQIRHRKSQKRHGPTRSPALCDFHRVGNNPACPHSTAVSFFRMLGARLGWLQVNAQVPTTRLISYIQKTFRSGLGETATTSCAPPPRPANVYQTAHELRTTHETLTTVN